MMLPSEMPLYSVQLKLKIGRSTICRTLCSSSGPATIHLVSWSSANTTAATVKPNWRLSTQNLLASAAEGVVLGYFGQMPPAASALSKCCWCYGHSYGWENDFRLI